MASPSEREAATAAYLVARAKAGEPHAFDALVRRYRKRIFALALHLSGSDCDVDDIVQDVFLRAYSSLDRFEGRSELFTWLYRLTINRALDARRSRARRSESSLDEMAERDPRIERALEVDAHGDSRRAAELRETYARFARSTRWGAPAQEESCPHAPHPLHASLPRDRRTWRRPQVAVAGRPRGGRHPASPRRFGVSAGSRKASRASRGAPLQRARNGLGRRSSVVSRTSSRSPDLGDDGVEIGGGACEADDGGALLGER